MDVPSLFEIAAISPEALDDYLTQAAAESSRSAEDIAVDTVRVWSTQIAASVFLCEIKAPHATMASVFAAIERALQKQFDAIAPWTQDDPALAERMVHATIDATGQTVDYLIGTLSAARAPGDALH